MAVPAQQDFSDIAELLTLSLTALSQFDILQALHGPAIHAQKVRVVVAVRCIWVQRFKTPNVVSHFGASQEPRIRQIVQSSEDGRLVDAQRLKRLRQ